MGFTGYGKGAFYWEYVLEVVDEWLEYCYDGCV